MSGSGERGALAIVLHTHMPYVEGFGTWPFGEEWLWEAMAGCYLPLLKLLDAGAPLTLSLTPVLCDQLEVPGVEERFAAFVRGVRRETHAEDAAGLRAGGHEALARELERSGQDYERALELLVERGGDLLGALAPHAQWTSSATHAVLPLLASDAGVRLQVRSGIASHRRRFGSSWQGGFWLPECAYAPSLERPLEEAGVSAVCVELTEQLGLGSWRQLRPIATEAGVTLVPIDRATMALVWSERGYPADGTYRDYHHHTVHHHNPWNNEGEAYRHEAALALARKHAADFVARTRARLEQGRADAAAESEALPGGGLVVCALDTELLGHWWYEGLEWLRAVVLECERQQLALIGLDDALSALEPAGPAGGVTAGGEQALRPGTCSWGSGGDLSTWSSPPVADMAFACRAAELDVLAGGSAVGAAAIRELLALQASDWAFMVSRGIAVPYAHERFDGHRTALARALELGPQGESAALRNLARDADRAALLAP